MLSYSQTCWNLTARKCPSSRYRLRGDAKPFEQLLVTCRLRVHSRQHSTSDPNKQRCSLQCGRWWFLRGAIRLIWTYPLNPYLPVPTRSSRNQVRAQRLPANLLAFCWIRAVQCAMCTTTLTSKEPGASLCSLVIYKSQLLRAVCSHFLPCVPTFLPCVPVS